MSNPLHIQVTLDASRDRIYAALTEDVALETWFAEHAAIRLGEQRYDYWGRYTPGTPSQDEGEHPLLALNVKRHIRYAWQFPEGITKVDIGIVPRDGQHVLFVRHSDLPKKLDPKYANLEDFWFLSLENLRRYLDSKQIVRCDFSEMGTGDIQHSVEIEAGAEAVYEALIRPEQLNRWIASNAQVEAVEGGDYKFGWGDLGAIKILDMEDNRKLSYDWVEGDETPDTMVTWELEETAGKTRLTMVHSGFAADHSTEGMQAGWLNFMSWIKSLVEYGAQWQPAIKQLDPESYAYYPASMVAAQDQIVEDLPAQAELRLDDARPMGRYVELVSAVSNVAEAVQFYASVGFKNLSPNLMTDGSINLRFASGAGPKISLHYYGCDLKALPDFFVQGDGYMQTAAPGDVMVLCFPDENPYPMPPGDIFTRQPHSQLGKFGSLSLNIPDVKMSRAFWEQLGFQSTLDSIEPYPWSIVTDGQVVVGLHQNNPRSRFNQPHMTYFSTDSDMRIANLQKRGMELIPMEPRRGPQIANAQMSGPGDLKFFLYEGEV
ncbi:MAG: hypothetical protein DWQ07_13740 [Chloroflexi bacterium]|nr:MAG: hypothetical protein DWQ07_13740 [Chloroflexota bacterium]MBL1194928.1 hypothetical protein [Chloroflexota bacterium]NOH12219.1 hypothetical protein [Chloroflexota bacterium]